MLESTLSWTNTCGAKELETCPKEWEWDSAEKKTKMKKEPANSILSANTSQLKITKDFKLKLPNSKNDPIHL